jgi:hypothetical protein
MHSISGTELVRGQIVWNVKPFVQLNPGLRLGHIFSAHYMSAWSGSMWASVSWQVQSSRYSRCHYERRAHTSHICPPSELRSEFLLC